MNQDKFKKIIFVRHGETHCNMEKRLQFLDDSLTEKGKEQMNKLKEIIANEKCEKIYSSDEIRAIESSEILNSYGLKIEKLKLIREKGSGDFSGKLMSEVDWSIVKGDFLTKKIPNGDSILDVKERALKFIRLLEESSFKNILVISHGTFLRVLYSLLFEEDIEEIILNKKFPNATKLIVGKRDGGWRLIESPLLDNGN